MFELLEKLNKQGKTIIYVTHSKELARRASRKITILDGRVHNT
jgi:ABC-type lipoprotein export system ATPase subunit